MVFKVCMRLFSYKNRPFHLGPYPLEKLARAEGPADFSDVPPMQALSFGPGQADEGSINLASPLGLFLGMLDAIRDGVTAHRESEIPPDIDERSKHLKSAGYYFDATQAGVCKIPAQAVLEHGIRNPLLNELIEKIETTQTKTLASGIDMIMADVRDSVRKKPSRIDHHTHAVVYLIEHPRAPDLLEPGFEWMEGSVEQRSAMRVGEVAVVISNYLRLMGFEARAHTMSSSDVDLGKLALAAGLVEKVDGDGRVCLENPYVGKRYSLAAVTTTLALQPDQILKKRSARDRRKSHGLGWRLGRGHYKSAANNVPFARRRYVDSEYPFEKLKRCDSPTTFIDAPRVARVPKRTDMFARGLFGDMGKKVQEACKGGLYVAKSPLGMCSRRAIGAMVLLQDGPVARHIHPSAEDPQKNSDNVKAGLYFLGADAVGLSACPDYAYYSHDASGKPIDPYHKNAVSIIVDQGHETMEGASGDDWIAVAQSMRAYLRASILGGVIAEQIRRLGYGARVHSVLDGEVLQPPLLLLSGLGEVSRIGEVILNPYLGPRLKSGVVTTDMPFVHDKPIDFGMQHFCEACNKCARECPSGAITAGPKKMFNGYEIWKSDSQRCTQYRVTNADGAMCGRCMKTCPWNLEGLFAEAPFRWLAMNFPQMAKPLARFDDFLGNGSINSVKKWWWDLELQANGHFARAERVSHRELQPGLDLKPEDQTLAVYPAHLAPPPHPVPVPMDREKGIEAHRALLSPGEHKIRLARGETENLVPQFQMPGGPPPVIPVEVADVVKMTEGISKYELIATDGDSLPEFEAGAHIDVCVAPEYIRQYSLAGDPEDHSRYVIGVLREDGGRGGSKLMHRIFEKGRKLFISRPVNHFQLDENADHSLLVAGGIGVTPIIAMAHRLHALGKSFELHYCARYREQSGFTNELQEVFWTSNVHYHFSSEGGRADFNRLLENYRKGMHLYTCGPAHFMDELLNTGERLGWPDDAMHREYFSVPETDDWSNNEFNIEVKSLGKILRVTEDKNITDVLAEHGIHIETKCSEGICGVCACSYSGGEVEHRDYVLGKTDRETKLTTCCSRAGREDGLIVLDL